MVIISIVKSSLALSLGLVGALSIVRFRSAIKEPEELAYLFLTIAMGLGLGAEQRMITIIATVIILAIIWARYFLGKKKEDQNLFITISSDSPSSIQLNDIIEVIRNNFKVSELRRFDEGLDYIEASFLVDAQNAEKIQTCKSQLQEKNKNVKVSFIDNKNY